MKNRSLNFKLLTGGTLCVLLPLLALAIFSDIQLSRGLKATNEQNTLSIAKNLSGLTQVVLQEEIKQAKGLAAGNDTIEAAVKVAEAGTAGASAEIQRMEQMLVNTMKQIGENFEIMYVCNADGTIYADSTGGNTKGISVKDWKYFQDAKANKIDVPSPVKSKLSGNPVVPICVPILSPSGQFTGALAVILKIDFLVERFLTVKVGKTGYPFMVDRNGIVIVHPNPKHILALNIKTLNGMESITEKMLAHQSGVENYTFEGINKVAAFYPVDLTGWSVCVNIPTDDLMSAAVTLRKTMVVMALLFLGITLVAVWFFSRSISTPINQISEGLNEGADQVASAAGELSSASQTLAEGSSEQAASIEETSTALEEMSSMTKQNASNAGQADALMKQANQEVNKANASMEQLTTSMQEISKASEETSKIIKTIDEIAFQTNLLALNAAVEAARAGVAGSGFAVVANEVRNLALRAADAAKNTGALIAGTMKKVTEGTALVKTTNDAFKEVSGSTAKVGELVAEIAAASSEQAQGIKQINIAVTEMNKVIQQNAATAEESASASEELTAQANELKGFVANLAAMLGGNGQVSSANPRRVSHPKAAEHAREGLHKALSVTPKKQQKEKSRPFTGPEKSIPMISSPCMKVS